jgi:fumarate reductase flavoprotein subunit
MWDDVGILRTAEGLSRALQALDEHDAELQAIGISDDDRRFNLTWHDWLNLESLVAVSKVIAMAALGRDDSRGAHFREDLPETADLDQSKFSRVRLSDGDLRLEMVPVDFSIVRPGQSLIEEQAGAPPTAA